LCHVSLDYEKEKSSSPMYKEYYLPDRSVIKIGHELFTTPEVLFQPSLIGRDNLPGIHESLMNVFDKCDGYAKALLSQNILLAGGCSAFPNMRARLSAELMNIYRNKYGGNGNYSLANSVDDCSIMKVKDPRERIMSSWTGGSILTSLPMFQQLWISKAEYDEMKSKILFSKCY
jgi:actin-related protein